VDHDIAVLAAEERARLLRDCAGRWREEPPRSPRLFGARAWLAARLRRVGWRLEGLDEALNGPASGSSITVRPARPEDGARLAALASMEELALPEGPLLVAVVDDEVEAAVPLEGGAAIANPFQPAAGLLILLRLRAEQLDGDRRAA
jgi:hypothetical protein